MANTRGHVRPRGDKWTAAVTLPKGADGKRRSKWLGSFPTRPAAQKAVTKALRELDTQAFNDSRGLTLAAYAERWFEQEAVACSWSLATIANYRKYWRLYAAPRVGKLPLDQVTPAVLRELNAELAQSGRADGKGGLDGRTVLHVHRLLANMLSGAVRDELLARNPAAAVRAPKAPPPHGVALSAEYTARLLAAAREHAPAWYVVILTALGTGLRRGEIVALRWEDVDLGRGVLHVRRAAAQVTGKLIYKAPKSDKGTRTVPLPAALVEELIRHKAQQATARLALGPGYTDHGLVFATRTGAPRSLASFSGSFRDFLVRVGLEHTTFHTLRHTYASTLLSVGVEMYLTSALMGHAGIGTTINVYGHLMGGEAQDAAERLDGALRKVVGGR